VNDDLYVGPTVLAPGPRQPNKLAELLSRWAVVPLIASLVVVFFVFYVFFSSAVVVGDSMQPTLQSGDFLLVTRGAPTLRRGDVIVTMVNEGGTPIELVKRVIGLPGDTVEIRNDVAYVNGLAEPGRGQFTVAAYAVSRPPLVVAPGFVYVLGDNRAVSEDSRDLGAVPESGIKGRAVIVLMPLAHVRPV
jgi:signal peptidase I